MTQAYLSVRLMIMPYTTQAMAAGAAAMCCQHISSHCLTVSNAFSLLIVIVGVSATKRDATAETACRPLSKQTSKGAAEMPFCSHTGPSAVSMNGM